MYLKLFRYEVFVHKKLKLLDFLSNFVLRLIVSKAVTLRAQLQSRLFSNAKRSSTRN